MLFLQLGLGELGLEEGNKETNWAGSDLGPSVKRGLPKRSEPGLKDGKTELTGDRIRFKLGGD